MFLCDPGGRIASWHPGAEHLFGYTEAEAVGKLGSMLFSPEDIASGQFELENMIAAERGTTTDIRWHVRKDGSRVFVTGTVIAIRNDSGTLLGFAKILLNTTDTELSRERLEDRAQDTELQLTQMQRQLRVVTAALQTSQEDERRRIARELHDDLSQRLAALEIGLAALQQKLPKDFFRLHDEFGKMRRGVGSASIEVRRLSHQLHPSVIDDLGLRTALRQLTDEFQSQRGQPVDFIYGELPDRIPAGLGLVFYRIAQEGLRNVAKHAGQHPVTVALTRAQDQLCLCIEDTGPGFDVQTLHGNGGLGLRSMQERAWLAGGTCSITSQPGRGTRIEVAAPLTRAEAHGS